MTMSAKIICAEREAGAAIPMGSLMLSADLRRPAEPRGVILFCQVSSRHSSRARFVADELMRAGFATVLIDLLTKAEEASDIQTGQYRLDIELLASRILTATYWVQNQPGTRDLPLGYFGVSIGAAAAMLAASRVPERVGAIVCRCGRVEFAPAALQMIQAPTLLIVGSRDRWVLQVNTAAHAQLQCRKRLEVVAGAGHLFNEPGVIQCVARMACAWFSEAIEDGGNGADR